MYLLSLLRQIWTNLSFDTCVYGTCLHRCGGTTEHRWRYSIYIFHYSSDITLFKVVSNQTDMKQINFIASKRYTNYSHTVYISKKAYQVCHIMLTCMCNVDPITPHFYMSRVVRKPAFCICENKDADQLRGNREADQRLCFRHTDSTIILLPKYEISSL